VEHVVRPSSDPSSPRYEIPARTQQRWRARFALAARTLVVLLGTAGQALLDAVVGAVGLNATTAELVEGFAQTVAPIQGGVLARLCELIHRLQPGLRVM
jgi:hypothetical protein